MPLFTRRTCAAICRNALRQFQKDDSAERAQRTLPRPSKVGSTLASIAIQVATVSRRDNVVKETNVQRARYTAMRTTSEDYKKNARETRNCRPQCGDGCEREWLARLATQWGLLAEYKDISARVAKSAK